MRTKLVHIKYFKWCGNPIAAKSEFRNDPNINVDVSGKDLLLQDINNPTSFVKVKRGLNIVAILDPRTNGYSYFRMSNAQLDDYVNTSNNKAGSSILLT